MVDRERIEAAVRELLAAIGENPEREGLTETPERVADAYSEFFSGVGDDPLRHLRDADVLTVGAQGVDDDTFEAEAVVVRGLQFRSMCEHHLLPFTGVAHVAYVPGRHVVGIGRIPRVVDTLAARPQIQERLTEQVADALAEGLEPLGVLVVIDASHGCMMHRGPRQEGSSTVTMASRGSLAEPAARAEMLTLMLGGAPS